MSAPASDNPPFATTDEAAADVGAAVDFILKRRGISKLNLLGWSWGTAIMSYYTVRNNDKVVKLVLYATSYIRQTPSLVQTGPGPLGAYRTVSMDAAKTRWLTGVAPDKAKDLIPAGWFGAWARARLASDPEAAKRPPPVIRAPNGVVLDGQRYWAGGKALFDPADVRVPTLLVKAEWDQDTPAYMSKAYSANLVNAPSKRYLETAEGTPTAMMEPNPSRLSPAAHHFPPKPTPRTP